MFCENIETIEANKIIKNFLKKYSLGVKFPKLFLYINM